MEFLNFNDIETKGEIRYRAEINAKRLEDEEYRPDKIFRDPSYNWPGDWEGRTILALVSDEKVLKKPAKYLADIMKELRGKLNGDLYFGEKLDKILSEQLLAGNSWFLRALCEHYDAYKDEQSMFIINTISSRLLIKLEPFFASYPTDKSIRMDIGEAIGDLLKESVNGWRLSTDTAAAFIAIDGLTHVYQLFPRAELKAVIEKAIALFAGIDKEALGCQTHATLSTTRGILRYYGIVKEDKYLRLAKELFDLYVKSGMTENYANFNWFNRPELTEGCAIIDSFIVAMELFKYTKSGYYASMFNRIYLNAFRFAQRSNGGIGCDSCVTLTQPFLKGGEGVFEAFWCCSMRAGEGIYRLSEFQYLVDDRAVYVPFYNDNKAKFFDGAAEIKQASSYPKEGLVKFEIKTERPFKLNLYIPKNAENVMLNGQSLRVVDSFADIEITESGRYELSFEEYIKKVEKSDKSMYFLGDKMLGEVSGTKPKRTYETDGPELAEIPDMSKEDFEKSKNISVKLVF